MLWWPMWWWPGSLQWEAEVVEKEAPAVDETAACGPAEAETLAQAAFVQGGQSDPTKPARRKCRKKRKARASPGEPQESGLQWGSAGSSMSLGDEFSGTVCSSTGPDTGATGDLEEEEGCGPCFRPDSDAQPGRDVKSGGGDDGSSEG